jgi:hypothetical protein
VQLALVPIWPIEDRINVINSLMLLHHNAEYLYLLEHDPVVLAKSSRYAQRVDQVAGRFTIPDLPQAKKEKRSEATEEHMPSCYWCCL